MSPPITLQMVKLDFAIACSWLHSQTVSGMGVDFEEPHLRLMV